MPNEHVNPSTSAKPGIPARDRWKDQIRVRLASGDFNAAKDLAQKALSEFLDDPDLEGLEEQAIQGKQRSVQAYQWMEESQQLFAEHNIEEGLQLLRSAYFLEERNPAIRSALVDALLCAALEVLDSDLLSAEALVGEAVSLDPANPVTKSVVQSILEEKQARLSSKRVSKAAKKAAVTPQRPETPRQHPEASRTIAETTKATPDPKAVASNPAPVVNRTMVSMTPGETLQESQQDPRSGPETQSEKAALMSVEQLQEGMSENSSWLSTQRVLAIVSIIFLLLAVFRQWPYDFYTLLRFLVCGSAAYLAFQAHERAMTPWVWIMGITAVLFNPFIPIYQSHDIWRPIDFAAAVLFTISLAVYRER